MFEGSGHRRLNDSRVSDCAGSRFSSLTRSNQGFDPDEGYHCSRASRGL